MNLSPVQRDGLVGPSPEQFAELFPFHFVVNEAGQVVQVGRTLGELCPALRERPKLEEHITIQRPAVDSLSAALARHLDSLFLLRLRGRELQLRGQILPLPGGQVMFVGSPWITDMADIHRLGLSVEEFALHDASLDLVHAVQAQRMSATDHQRLVERLKAQRAELQQTNAQLKAREAEATKLAHVAVRTHNAVVITDRDGRVEWGNEGFTRLTGYTLSDILGKKPGNLLQGPDTDPRVVGAMRDKLAAREGFHAEILNYSKEGRRYWVDIEVQPVLSESGDVTNFIAIEQDITARVEDEQRRRLQQSVSSILAESDSLEQGMPLLLRSMAISLNAGFGACWPVEHNALGASPFTVWTDGELGRDVAADCTMVRCRERLATVEHSDEPVFLSPDTTGSGCDCRLSQAIIAIPCRADGKIFAKVLLVGDKVECPPGEMLRLLGLLGNQAGQFIARNQARRELQRSRDFALQVMNLMGQGLTVTDENGALTFVNEAFVTMVGRSREELIGRSPSEVSVAADEETFTRMSEERRGGRASCYEVNLLRPGGEMLPVMVTGVPRLDKGRLAGSIGVVTDLSEQKRVERQMAAALARERELNGLKSSFVTMASHEFRTPLTGIVYAAEMLNSHINAMPDGPGGKQQRYLDIIFDGSRRMSDLMNDLLLLGRIESGKLSCVPAKVDLAGFAEELKCEAGSGHERIEIELGPGLPATALVDTNILRHALINLLSNALKYSPSPAAVCLRLITETEGDLGPVLCFQVQDHGCGIPVAEQEKMFQPFFRASNVGKVRGTGIGLTIARDCARLHGGDVTFVSESGVGTTFSVRVPLGGRE